MSCTLVILAAGMGSRYGGLKQIDPIGPNGEIVIDYSIYDAIQAGFDEVVFIIRKDIQEAFEEAVLSKWESKIKCRCVFQELDALPAGFSVPEGRTKPWGTGHALLQCLGVVQNNFCVINADDFYGADAFAQVADTLKSMPKEGYNYSMVAFELSKTLSENGTVSRGVCTVDENQKLVSVVETLKIAKEGVMHCLSKKLTQSDTFRVLRAT